MTRVEEGSGEPNDPRAVSMAAIAFLNVNVTLGCLWGTFGVLMLAVEARFGVGPQLATLAVPLVTLATAIVAPIAGFLATRTSLRILLVAGTLLSTIGFALLATIQSFPVYLIAYGLFLGPGMAIGVILPGTLVTRWFSRHRGKALGIINTHALVIPMPLLATAVLAKFGLNTVYAMLAGLSALAVIANLFVIDRRPDRTARTTGGTSEPIVGASTIFRSQPFWAVLFVFALTAVAATLVSAQSGALAKSWGHSPTVGALFISIQSLAGLAGTVILGWLADRLGGVRTMAIIAFDGAMLWLALSFTPSLPITFALLALFGLHGAGVVPVLSVSLSEHFGREGFSRAFGLANLLNLPFSVAGIPLAAAIYGRTGSYTPFLLGIAGMLAASGLFALIAARSTRPTLTT